MRIRQVDPKLLKPHPLAYLIPDMRPSEWQNFYTDISFRKIKVPLEVLADGTVLDGLHRRRAAIELGMKTVPVVDAPLNGDSPEEYMLKAAVLRRHLTDDQRAAIARLWIRHNKQERDAEGKFQPLPPRGGNGEAPNTHRKAQELFKVGQKKLDQITYMELHSPELFEKVHQGDIPLKEAQKQLKEETNRKRRDEIKIVQPHEDSRFRLIEGDFATEYQRLTPESIDAIITDPPYSEKYLDLYSKLAEAASLLLKSGGSLLVMTGQSYLPDVLNRLTPYLTYHWTVAYLTPGGQSPQLWQKKVNASWKPVLWFTKGEYAGEWVGDVVRSAVNDNDKTFHEWGQSESGFTELVKRFTREGDLILDPFMGAGTTGVVAIRLDRQFIGIDISADQVSIARGRILKELNAAAVSYSTNGES